MDEVIFFIAIDDADYDEQACSLVDDYDVNLVEVVVDNKVLDKLHSILKDCTDTMAESLLMIHESKMEISNYFQFKFLDEDHDEVGVNKRYPMSRTYFVVSSYAPAHILVRFNSKYTNANDHFEFRIDLDDIPRIKTV